MYSDVHRDVYICMSKCTSGMYSGINVQVNVQVKVWNCDPLHDHEFLDMIHDDDDVMMHAMMMHSMMYIHSYTLCYRPWWWHVQTLMFDDLTVTSSVDEQFDQQYWCLIWQWWHGQKDDVAVISIGMIWQWLEYRGCWAAVSKWTR